MTLVARITDGKLRITDGGLWQKARCFFESAPISGGRMAASSGAFVWRIKAGRM